MTDANRATNALGSTAFPQMALIRQFSIKVGSADLADVLIRVRDSLKGGEAKLQIYFEDSPSGGGIAELVSALPQLRAFCLTDDTIGTSCISNLSSEWDVANPIDAQLTLETAVAVGQTSLAEPLWHALFVFRDVPGLQMSTTGDGYPAPTARCVSDPRAATGGELIVNHYCGLTRVFATVSEPAPVPSLTVLPAVSGAAHQLLTAIGEPKQTSISLVRARAEIDARALLFRPNYDDHVELLSALTPFIALKALSSAKGAHIPSPKADLKAAFEPMGYTYQSKYSCDGGYQLSKRTSNFNEIWLSIDCDPGSFWRRTPGQSKRNVCAMLHVHGIDWVQGLSLPVAQVGTERIMQFTVRDQAEWLKAVDNLVALVVQAEEIFVPAVEAAYGRGLAWASMYELYQDRDKLGRGQ